MALQFIASGCIVGFSLSPKKVQQSFQWWSARLAKAMILLNGATSNY